MNVKRRRKFLSIFKNPFWKNDFEEYCYYKIIFFIKENIFNYRYSQQKFYIIFNISLDSNFTLLLIVYKIIRWKWDKKYYIGRKKILLLLEVKLYFLKIPLGTWSASAFEGAYWIAIENSSAGIFQNLRIIYSWMDRLVELQ